jgi:hypothetical protein
VLNGEAREGLLCVLELLNNLLSVRKLSLQLFIHVCLQTRTSVVHGVLFQDPVPESALPEGAERRHVATQASRKHRACECALGTH